MKKPRISHVKLRVQIDEKPPQELIDAYIKGAVKSSDKVYQRLKEAVPDVETVIEKMIKPVLKGTKGLFKPDAFTTRGTKIKDSLNPTRAVMEKWAKRWFKRTEYAYRNQGKDHAEIMAHMAPYHAREMTLLVLPFCGYKDKIRGLGPVAGRWLTGDLTVLEKINRREIIEGQPVDIIRADDKTLFRRTFTNCLTSVGGQLIKSNYVPTELRYANARLNQVVNLYAESIFRSFGLASTSHVVFIKDAEGLFLDVKVLVAE